METKLDRKLTEDETTVLQKCGFTSQTTDYIASLLSKKPLQKKPTLIIRVIVVALVLCILAFPIILFVKWLTMRETLPQIQMIDHVMPIMTIVVYISSGLYTIGQLYAIFHRYTNLELFNTRNLEIYSNPWKQFAKMIPMLVVTLLSFAISNWGLFIATALIFVMTILEIIVVVGKMKSRVKEL